VNWSAPTRKTGSSKLSARVRVLVSHHLGPREAGECQPCELEARLKVEIGRLVAGGDGDKHEQPLEREVVEGGFCKRHVTVVGRVEDAAVETCHG
jgi:hypothetical protein